MKTLLTLTAPPKEKKQLFLSLSLLLVFWLSVWRDNGSDTWIIVMKKLWECSLISISFMKVFLNDKWNVAREICKNCNVFITTLFPMSLEKSTKWMTFSRQQRLLMFMLGCVKGEKTRMIYEFWCDVEEITLPILVIFKFWKLCVNVLTVSTKLIVWCILNIYDDRFVVVVLKTLPFTRHSHTANVQIFNFYSSSFKKTSTQHFCYSRSSFFSSSAPINHLLST